MTEWGIPAWERKCPHIKGHSVARQPRGPVRMAGPGPPYIKTFCRVAGGAAGRLVHGLEQG